MAGAGAAHVGKLDMIIGPMFAGKTSEVIKRIRQAKLLSKTYLIVNHIFDTRYGNDHIVTHDAVKEKCKSLDRLAPLMQDPNFTRAEMVFIEEAQFFEDLEEFAVTAVEEHGKHVIVSALDGDYQRKPFMNVSLLMPFADEITRLSALCMQCKDGTRAPFTKRVVTDTHKVLVGSMNEYVSVCRKHYVN